MGRPLKGKKPQTIFNDSLVALKQWREMEGERGANASLSVKCFPSFVSLDFEKLTRNLLGDYANDIWVSGALNSFNWMDNNLEFTIKTQLQRDIGVSVPATLTY